MKKYLIALGSVGFLATPLAALAAVCTYNSYSFPTSSGTVTDIVCWAFTVVNGLVIPVIISLAVLAFLWGVLQSIRKADQPEARSEGAKFILYGIIGLAIMFGFWGLVTFVLNTFNIQYSANPTPIQFGPTTPTPIAPTGASDIPTTVPNSGGGQTT